MAEHVESEVLGTQPQSAAAHIRVANAPCSWGVLEFESTASAPGYAQVLDEIARSGYAGTELGDWGFMPTQPDRLRDALAARRLALLGAFVTLDLRRAETFADGIAVAVRTAQLMSAAGAMQPFIVLSDVTATDPERTRCAGRIAQRQSLSDRQWDVAAQGVTAVAQAVHDATGLRTVFHHHCAAFVETPREVDALMTRTDAALVGLCLDTGHITYGGGSPLDLLRRYGNRVWHVHFKDCEPVIAERARTDGWDYLAAIRHGLFCELGRGSVDFHSVLEDLRARDYQGWIVVEQDVLPSLGSPLASATRNREYLRSLGL